MRKTHKWSQEELAHVRIWLKEREEAMRKYAIKIKAYEMGVTEKQLQAVAYRVRHGLA